MWETAGQTKGGTVMCIQPAKSSLLDQAQSGAAVELYDSDSESAIGSRADSRDTSPFTPASIQGVQISPLPVAYVRATYLHYVFLAL